MPEIKLNTFGKIIEGSYKGWYIFVKDDRAGKTGGLNIFVSEHKEPIGEGYDSWIEDINFLEPFFEDSKWKIRWDESPAATDA